MKKERTPLGSEESWMASLGSVLSCMDWLNAPGLGSLTSAEAFASLSAQNTSLRLQRGQCVWGEGPRGLSFLESIHLASLREKSKKTTKGYIPEVSPVTSGAQKWPESPFFIESSSSPPRQPAPLRSPHLLSELGVVSVVFPN
ncbi:hypothetical protein J1605_007542 [Eschrichtius robustus]|uniref:Uncharacterized protein n=1 Tax=Eschrichtius robustus TaxID=9764 RepID=A0AB34H1N7_ESCRO|nr:hypothetical protein J1605_007542 [Eschrichtius robustus]